MNVLSLFDGMSCGQIALNRLGLKVDNYFASEVDKYAIQTTKKNYPGTKHLGDVREVNPDELPKIDILIGGSPCQSFSFAGKKKGMSTKCEIEILSLEHYLELKEQNFQFEGQSYLFWEYMRLLKAVKPKYFLLENVVMSSKWENVMSKAIGIKPIKINSALVSAQNRNRLYWTNIKAEPQGLFDDLECMIQQPKDKGIVLKDVLEKDVDEKYFLKNFNPKYKSQSNQIHKGERFGCLTSGTYGYSMGYIIHNRQPRCGDPKKGGTGPLSRQDGKTYCLDTGQSNAVEIVAMRGRYDEKGKIKQHLESRKDNKTNTLTTVEKDNYLRENSKVRRLTPIECERLQTVPDNYTEGVSDTQRYKMLGNGWTVDVICHILKHIDNV